MDKQFNHLESQEKLRSKWLEEKTYNSQNNPGEAYSIDTPPPTVSGTLHIGHIFSYAQTDFIARYKRMRGFSVLYPFGFDDNGLATERYVEKKRSVKAHQIGRSAFINICLEETKQAEHEFQDLWQQMGLSSDWDLCYSTISPQVRALSQAAFIDLYNKGYVYRKDEPALYCTTCHTSVAQAELDTIEQPSSFNDIVFKDAQQNDLLIGTTRPELLASCVALLFHPADERYQHLADQQATVPLFNFTVPIIADEKVQMDKGTGLVMCCTFGDTTDIDWYKKFNFPYKQSIDAYGKMTDRTGFLKGLKVVEARAQIIQELIKHNLLIRQQSITHTVNIHERCKKEIEYVVLKQWFINVIDHKQTFLDLADQIEWYPAFMKARYVNWVENIRWDWCISRQRFFGIPFPVWHCSSCNAIVLADIKALPIDPQELPAPHTCACGNSNLTPDTDVMDTWNTSSISPYICEQLFSNTDTIFGDGSSFSPMSMRPQAHDIIRTWAFYTIIKTWMHHKTIPWKTIVISGHVLSSAKEKLSKSQNNAALTPTNLLQQYPADVIRYWTASGSLGQDVAFSQDQLKIGHRLLTKLWNAFRFISMHLEQAPTQSVLTSSLGIVNEWILDAISHAYASYTRHFEQHEFGLALHQVEQFFWNDFCDNYLELIKNQLFNPDEYDIHEVYATKWTLYHVGLRILQLFAPYFPYMTEEIYQELYRPYEKSSSLHITKYNAVQKEHLFAQSATQCAAILSVIAQVRKLKTSARLSLKAELNELTIHTPDTQTTHLFEQQELLIRGITHTHTIHYSLKPIEAPSLQEMDGIWHAHVVGNMTDGSSRKME